MARLVWTYHRKWDEKVLSCVICHKFAHYKTMHIAMNQSYVEALVTICNMRLLFDTKQELGQHIGFSLAQNTIRKLKPDFQQRAVYHELANEFEELVGDELPLDDIIDKYEEASELSLSGDSGDDWVFGWLDGTEDILLAVLVMLMVKGWLPRYGSRTGDVSNIGRDFDAMFELLDRYTKRTPRLKELPFVQRVRQLVQEGSEEEGINSYCRAVMIHAAWIIVMRYRYFQYPDQLPQMEGELGLCGDIDIEGYWSESGGDGLWHIEVSDRNAYDATYYYKGDRGLRSIKYTLMFVEEHMEAVLSHPMYAKRLIEEGHIDTDTMGNFECELNDDSRPTAITLTQYTDRAMLPKKVAIERIEDGETIADIEAEMLRRDIKADFPDCFYDFTICLHSITHDAVYVECDGNKLYRIPKDRNPEFESAGIDDKIGVITLGDKTYIAYDNVLLYIDATDEKALLLEHGIEVVQR